MDSIEDEQLPGQLNNKDELAAIMDNIKKIQSRIESSRNFQVYTKWQFHGEMDIESKWLPLDKLYGGLDKSFHEVQVELYNKGLYSSVADNHFNMVGQMHGMFEDLDKYLKLLVLEAGKIVLHTKALALQDAQAFSSIGIGVGKIVKTVEKHEELLAKKERDNKAVEELQKELEDLRARIKLTEGLKITLPVPEAPSLPRQ